MADLIDRLEEERKKPGPDLIELLGGPQGEERPGFNVADHPLVFAAGAAAATKAEDLARAQPHLSDSGAFPQRPGASPRNAPSVPFSAFDPVGRQAAVQQTRQILLEEGNYFPPGAANHDAIVGLSDKYTEKFLRLGGMLGLRDLTPRKIDELRGAFLRNFMTIYSSPSAEELGAINARAIQNVGGLLEQNIQAALSEVGARRDAGEQIPDAVTQNLQQDFAQIREMSSRSNEAAYQDFFSVAAGDRFRRQAEIQDPTLVEQDEFEILSNLLDSPVRGPFGAAHRYITHPIARRYAEILDRHLVRRDPATGRLRPMGYEDLMRFAYQGALLQTRAERLGVPPEHVQELSPEGLISYTHPQLFRELGELKALDLAERAPTLSAELMGRDTPEDVIRHEMARGLMPSVGAFLLLTTEAPLQQLAAEASTPTPGPGGLAGTVNAAADAVGGAFNQLATSILSGTRSLGDALSRAEEFWLGNQRVDAFDRAVIGHTLDAGAAAAEEGFAEGERRARIVIPNSPLRDGNGWAGEPTDLYYYEREQGHVTRAGLEELIPYPNFLRLAGFIGFEEQAAEILREQGERRGFSREVLQRMLGAAKEAPVEAALDQLFGPTEGIGHFFGLRGFKREDVDAQAAHTVGAFRSGDISGGVLSALATGIMFTGNEMRENARLITSDPEVFTTLNLFGAGAGAALNPILRGISTPVLERVKRIMSQHRASTVISEAIRESGEAPRRLHGTIGRMMEEGGDVAKYKALEAATDALDHITKIRRDAIAHEGGYVLPTRPLSNAQLRGEVLDGAKRVEKIVKYMDGRGIDELLSDLRVDDSVKNWVQRPGVLKSLVEVAARRLGYRVGRKNLRPSFLSSAEGILRQLVENPERALALPTIPEYVDAASRGLWGRIIGRPAADAGALVGTITRFLRSEDDILAVRAYNAERLANTDEFLDMLTVGSANREREIAMMEALARDPADVEAAQAQRRLNAEAGAQIQSAQKLLRSRTFDSGIQGLAGLPLFGGQDVEKFLAFLSTKYGDGEIFNRLRKFGETSAEFSDRVARLSRRWDEDVPGLALEADTFKREIIETFFDAPGLKQRVTLDASEGFVSSARARRLLRPEREAVRAAARMLKRPLRPGEEFKVLRTGEDVYGEKLLNLRDKITRDVEETTRPIREALESAETAFEETRLRLTGPGAVSFWAGAESAEQVLQGVQKALSDLMVLARQHPERHRVTAAAKAASRDFNKANRDLQRLATRARRGEDVTPLAGRAQDAVADAFHRTRASLDETIRLAGENPGLLRAVDEVIATRDRSRRLLALAHENPGLTADVMRRSPDDWFGLRQRTDLRDIWDEVLEDAGREGANLARMAGKKKFGNWVESMQALGSGDPRLQRRAARDAGRNMRANMRSYWMRLEAAQRIAERMAPAERELFDLAVGLARDEGINAPLSSLRKQFPEMFRVLAPATADDAIQGLLDEFEGFRQGLLRDLHDIGALTDDTFTFLAKPYGPRSFSAYESPLLLGAEAREGLESVSGFRGTNATLGEIRAQRHATRWKAQAYPRGGAPVTQHFKDKDEAVGWLRRNFGLQEDTERVADGVTRGLTATGDPVAILDPLGADVARALGELPAGASLQLRLSEVMTSSLERRWIDGLDRRGHSLSVGAWEQLKIRTPQEAAKFQLVPESPRMGRLAGRYVRREVLDTIAEFSSGRAAREAVDDATEREMFRNGVMGRVLGTAAAGVNKTARAMTRGLTYTQIALSTQVGLVNFLGDGLLFSPLAGDLRINVTGRGFRAGLAAARDMWALRRGKLLASELPERLQEALSAGVIDEQFFGRSTARTRNSRAVYGALSGERGLKSTDLYGDTRAAIRAFFAPFSDPRRRKLVARHDQILKEMQGPHSDALKLTLAEEQLALERTLQMDTKGLARAWAKASNLGRYVTGENLRALAGGPEDVERFAKGFYGDLGNLNRLRTFYYLRDQGVSADAAGQRISSFMQTYSGVPLPLRRLSERAFGAPVLSFPYELGRITLNALRHRPGVTAGLLLTGLGRNVAAMAATGTNPYQVYAEHKRRGGSDLSLPFSFMGSQVIPGPDGEFSMATMPGLSVFETYLENFGAWNGIMGAWEDPTAGPLEGALRGVGALGSKFFLGNPVSNTIASLISRRDPRTGDVQRDTPALLSSNAVHLLQLFIPPWTPYVGSAHDRLQEAVGSGPQAYSGRRITLLQTASAKLFGLRWRGDLQTLLPEGVRSPLEQGAAGLAMLLGVEVPEDPNLIQGEGRLLGVQDLYATIRGLTAAMEKNAGPDLGAEVSPELRDVRRGIDWMESPDPALKERGRELLRDARSRFLAKRASQSTLDSAAQRSNSPRDFRLLIGRARALTDEGLLMSSISLPRRTAILGLMEKYGAAKLPGGEAFMGQLYQQYLLTAGSNTGLRAPSVPEEIQASLTMVNGLIHNPTPAMNTERLETLRSFLGLWHSAAQVQELRVRARDSRVRAAVNILEELDDAQ